MARPSMPPSMDGSAYFCRLACVASIPPKTARASLKSDFPAAHTVTRPRLASSLDAKRGRDNGLMKLIVSALFVELLATSAGAWLQAPYRNTVFSFSYSWTTSLAAERCTRVSASLRHVDVCEAA